MNPHPLKWRPSRLAVKFATLDDVTCLCVNDCVGLIRASEAKYAARVIGYQINHTLSCQAAFVNGCE
jgi:hypothetical protein